MEEKTEKKDIKEPILPASVLDYLCEKFQMFQSRFSKN